MKKIKTLIKVLTTMQRIPFWNLVTDCRVDNPDDGQRIYELTL